MAVGKRSSERALQKVLGKGANVNEANPLEAYIGKVGIENLRTLFQVVFGGGADIDIKASLDTLQSIEFGHRIGRSLNDVYLGVMAPENVAFYGEKVIDLDTYWTSAGLFCPKEQWLTRAISRRTFKHPYMGLKAKLPPLTAHAWITHQFGFVSEPSTDQGMGLIVVDPDNYRIYVGADPHFTNLAITGFLPADYETAFHNYYMKLNKCSFWFLVNGIIKAIVLTGIPETLPEWTNGPYALDGIPCDFSFTSPVLYITAQAGTIADTYTPFDPPKVVAQDGEPMPPWQFPLYNENTTTKWNGLSTDVVVTSHPVPIWGYDKKTLHFQANAAGALDVEIYVGGDWRGYDRSIFPKTLTADELFTYIMEGRAPIVRCKYTPTNSDTIAVAEWHLE